MPSIKKNILLKGFLYSFLLQLRNGSNGKVLHQNHQILLDEIRPYETQQLAKARYVADVIRIITRRAPWRPKCMNLALVAKKLLKQQGLESTIHIGFKKEKNSGVLKGHVSSQWNWIKIL